MESLLKQLHANPFVLAPMAGITDCAFRSFMKEMGASIVVTELVSATGLRYSSQRTRKLMEFTPLQHPIGIQIFGESLEDLDYAAKEVEQMGADFVDLNFGCPVPKVVKKGAGAAILKDPVRLRSVLKTVKAAVKIPVTIKVRTGWDESSRNAVEVANIASDEGITWMAIHGRTRAQGYSGQADWDYISEVKRSARIPILGNGDITSAELAVERLQSSGCDGVLIGRGCLKNPWIFRQSLQLLNKTLASEPLPYTELFRKLRFHLQQHAEDRIVGLQIKKMAAWYSHGFSESSAFRKRIFQAQNSDDVYAEVLHYFQNKSIGAQQDTSGEAFLMGGHG